MTLDLNEVKPSTIEGIKRLATRLKKRDGLSHSVALDVAARQGGFRNFHHARSVLVKDI